MKNIEQILKDAGIEMTEEQKTSIVSAVAENYKTLPDYQKQTKKLENAESEKQALSEQIDNANAMLEKFKDLDPEKIQAEIDGYKQAAADAEAKAQKSLTERDQRDALNAEFDRLGIKSERTRKSLMDEIMGDDGLKWKDGKFMGLNDYLTAENEKDHFYQTEEEIEAQKKADEARGRAPRFTQPSEPKLEPIEEKNIPAVW